MKNKAIIILSILLSLVSALAVYQHKKLESYTTDEKARLANPTPIDSDAYNVCVQRSVLHNKVGDYEGGALAMAQCSDPSLYEQKNEERWLAEYRRANRQ